MTPHPHNVLACALAAALACAGCTITLAGSDAGAGDAGTTETVGQQCTAILTELCTQAINRCALTSFTVTECVSNDMGSCCMTSCGNTSGNPQSAVDACKAAFDSEDCNAVVNNTTPSDCTSLVGQP